MGMNALVSNVLEEIGVNPERFSLKWASAAEAPRFVKLITEFTGKIKDLGPLGQSEGIEPDEIKARLNKALGAVSSRKVRMVFGNTTKAIRKEGIFTQEYINAVIEEKLNKSIVGALSAEAEEGSAGAETEKKSATEAPAPAKKAETKKAATKAKPAAKLAAPKKTAAKAKPPAKKAAPDKAVAKKTTPKKKTTGKKKK